MKFPLPFCINRFTLSYALAVVVFFAVIYLSPFGGDTSQIEMNNCFAILVFASLLWALEVRTGKRIDQSFSSGNSTIYPRFFCCFSFNPCLSQVS